MPAPSLGLTAAFDQINGLGIDLDGIVIALANLLQDVAHLVHPARWCAASWVHGLDSSSQSGAAVGDDQQQLVAFQSAPIQIVQQRLPVGLALDPRCAGSRAVAGSRPGARRRTPASAPTGVRRAHAP
jgi:hypothetical protein